jgi:hypothetical protein
LTFPLNNKKNQISGEKDASQSARGSLFLLHVNSPPR